MFVILDVRLEVWIMGFGNLEFGISSLVFWIWDFEIGVCVLEFWILGFCVKGFGFGF